MSHTSKTLLGFLFTFCFVGVMVFGSLRFAAGIHWATLPLVLSLALSLAILSILVWATYRPSKAPELLRQCGPFFERDGVCFQLAPTWLNGKASLACVFENRYQGPAFLRLTLRPQSGLPTNQGNLACVEVAFAIEGGSFGVTHIPWAISSDLPHNQQRVSFHADVHYPQGKGPLLRFRDGIAVPGLERSSAEVAGLVGSFFGSSITLESPPEVMLLWYAPAPEMVDVTTGLVTETLWSPAMPGSLNAAVEALEQFQTDSPSTEDLTEHCEVCGASGASTVSYTTLIGLGPLFYVSRSKAHIHCPHHRLRHGLRSYLVTLLTGWIGLSIAGYPFLIYQSAMSLHPVLGWKARVMGIVPGLLVLGLIAGAIVRALR